MKSQKGSFTGFWCVAALEFNTAGVWRQEYAFQPHEWNICFLEDGFFGEMLRDPVESKRGTWSVDSNGIIIIAYDSEAIDKCVFREEWRGTYLYMYDDQRHIVPDPSLIVKHHAFSRYRLERLDPCEIKYEKNKMQKE